MMIRILCLSVLVMLFCTDIEAGKEKHKKLKCFTCTKKYCSKYHYCKHGQICMSAAVVELTHGKKEKSFFRACTSPSYCKKVGRKGTVSIAVGAQVFVATVKCCDSHLCNIKLPPHPRIKIWKWGEVPFVPQTTTPEPPTPELPTPEPTNPEPPTPEPTNPEPTTPEPPTPEPTNPEPTTPKPTHPPCDIKG